MDPLVAAILIGIPLAWLVGLAVYAYYDAPDHGMNPRKWAAIAFFVPLFGFFAYLFEREERYRDPADDPYTRGRDVDSGFAVHESRQGEKPLGPAETEADDPTENAADEWNDPPGVDGPDR